MLVVAFDGILFDTLEFRARAIVDAFAAEGVQTTAEAVRSVLPTLSLAEAVRIAAATAHLDETTLDIVTLRAERTIGEMGSRGAVLNVAVGDRLRRAAAVTRIVIRADSRRREVEQLLAMAELEAVTSFLCCSDDSNLLRASPATLDLDRAVAGSPSSAGVTSHASTPAATSPTAPHPSSIARSYAHIAQRLYANTSLLGTGTNIGIALEVGEVGRVVARVHGFGTPESFDAMNLPRH